MKINTRRHDTINIDVSDLELRILATALARFSGRPNIKVTDAANTMRTYLGARRVYPFHEAHITDTGAIGVPASADLKAEFDDPDEREFHEKIVAAHAEEDHDLFGSEFRAFAKG